MTKGFTNGAERNSCVTTGGFYNNITGLDQQMPVSLLEYIQGHSILYTSCEVVMLTLHIYLPALIFIPVSDLQHWCVTYEMPEMFELIINVLFKHVGYRRIVTCTILHNQGFLFL